MNNQPTIKEIRKDRPRFLRQEGHRRSRLAQKWRQPKGIQSKMRRKFRSKGPHPGAGYGSPKAWKGLDASGLAVVHISNGKQLSNLDPKKHMIIVSRTLGLKKKLEVVKKAKEMGLQMRNIRDEKKLEEMAKKRKEEKQEKVKEKEEKKKAEAEKEQKSSVEAKVEEAKGEK